MGNTISGTNGAFRDPGTILERFVYRDQSGRYPWWVKSVDRITTPVDASIWERKTTDKFMMLILDPDENEKAKVRLEKARKRMLKKMRNQEPGSRLQDFALHYASETYFAAGIDLFNVAVVSDDRADTGLG